jgi:hypothetical protein
MSGPEPVADDDEYPTDEELAKNRIKLFGEPPSSATDDLPPTDEEIARNEKKLFGDHAGSDMFGPKVVPIRSAQPADDTSAEGAVVNKLNKYYAKVMLGNKFKIIDESVPGVVRFLDEKDFIAILRSEKALITLTDPGGTTIKAKYEPVTTIWLNHRKARIYRMVIFDPRREFNPNVWGPNVDYNLWRGFATKSVRVHGAGYKVLRYIRDILCDGNKDQFRWLMAWVAHMRQRPWEKPETAIAIQGEEEGTGKSFFPWILSKLLDGDDSNITHRLYFKASNSKLITGDFSGHLERILLLHAEEAFSAENERENSIIKDLISGEDMSIHPKNIEARISKNYIRLILSGNPPHIVKAGRFARRFLVLKISPKQRLNTDYFRELSDDLFTGGFEALMYYLDHYPIFKYNLRVAPKTAALAEQKDASSSSEEQFWRSRLYTGELRMDGTTENKYYSRNIGTEYLIIKNRLYREYEAFARKLRNARLSDEVWFGRRFSKFFNAKDSLVRSKINDTGAPLIGLASDKLGDNTNYYVIPKLSICRQLFSDYVGQPVEWPDDSEEWTDKPFG